ncbi:hypothetical protein MMC19_001088 [Ptychographa xylographoides]|nr:hypothetical protein [Ptychographa xylographoides]
MPHPNAILSDRSSPPPVSVAAGAFVGLCDCVVEIAVIEFELGDTMLEEVMLVKDELENVDGTVDEGVDDVVVNGLVVELDVADAAALELAVVDAAALELVVAPGPSKAANSVGTGV